MIVNSNRFNFADVASKQLARFGSDTAEAMFEAVDEDGAGQAERAGLPRGAEHDEDGHESGAPGRSRP